ncbi:MAG TPA: cobalt ABC transporter permease, partial [Acholeplasmataceae bacterium]|nr:cobalt ABC transporter permease [Acholeplasmataceae bacterium]
MNIKIGQYIAGDSILHRLDPRIKIMSMMLLIITIFLVPINTKPVNIIWMGALFVFSLSIVLLSGIRIGQVLQGLKAVVFLMTFTFLIQLFTIQPEGE